MIKSIRSNRQQKRYSQWSGNGRRARDRRPSFLGLERMEDRTMFSMGIEVNSGLDLIDGSDSLTTLREAIIAANANGGDATITFSAAFNIEINSNLPVVQGSGTTIDGLVGTERVRLDGSMGSADTGLTLLGSNHSAKSLMVTGFFDDGVRVESSQTLIQNNVITGNQGDGIQLGNADASSGASLGVTISGNVLDNNFANGILVVNASDNVVRGNLLGIDADGAVLYGNRGDGVRIAGDSSNNLVGGPAASDANVVVYGYADGVRIMGGDNNRVIGNLVGVEATATMEIGNSGNGVTVADLATNSVVVGNVVSGNFGFGIFLGAPATVSGNLVGTSSGGGNLGNDDTGIRIVSSGSVVTGNTVAFNGEAPVGRVVGNGIAVVTGSHNTIAGNSIHSNFGIGIDLGDDGIGAISGANADQAAPVLSAAHHNTGLDLLTVTGTLAAPDGYYTIELFASDAPAPGDDVEGKTFLGSFVVQVVGGTLNFDRSISVVSGSGVITATATSAAGDTSEFSGAVDVTGGQVLDLSNTQTTLVSSANPSILGASVTFTATVLDMDAPTDIPTGLVIFKDGDVEIGSVAVDAAGQAVLTVPFNALGDHVITASYVPTGNFTTSGAGLTQQVIEVPVNHAPVAGDDPASGAEDATIDGSVLGNDSDEDNDSLSAVLVDGPSHGTLTLNPDGTFSYTPAANWSGTDTFTYVANDGELDSNVATVTITVSAVNDAPLAADDSATTDEDTSVTIDVLPNDSDIDGDSLSAQLVAGPSHGTVVLNPDGTFTYTPDADYFGEDSFTYTAADGDLDSNLATVTITINPVDDPTGATISGRTVRDVTGNGLTSDDTALSGVIVQLFLDVNNDGVLTSADGAAIATVTSDSMGGYVFTSVEQGDYFVQETVPTGYLRTTPALSSYYSAEVTTTSISGLDFANYKVCPCPQYLSDVYFTINPGTPEEKVVTNLRGNTNEGDIVQVTFTVLPPAQNMVVTLVSYTAPGGSFVASDAYLQEIYDLDTGVFGPGTHNLTVVIPDSYYQVDFVCGYAIDTFGPAGSNGFYTPQGRLISADNDGNNAYTGPQTVVPDVRQDAHPDGNHVRGYVYHDVDSDGVKDSGEGAISGVTMQLRDAGGNVVATTTTNSSGRYTFSNVPSGTYTISEVQASGYVDGKDTVGNLGGVVSGVLGDDQISQIVLGGYQFAENYNFGEVKAAKLSGYVYKDLDNDAKKESGESGIKSVTIKLTGVDDFGNAVSMTLCTNSSGYYEFAGLRPGTYSIQEVDPSGYGDGKESLGTLGGVKLNDLFTDIVVNSGAFGKNYNFGELKVSYC